MMESTGKQEQIPDKNVISKKINTNLLDWPESITKINLSGRNLSCFEESIKFPLNLTSLDLSHNLFEAVPGAVMILENITELDISYNKINYFNDCPSFCQSIIKLNLAANSLSHPPYWVWSKTPKKLEEINISNNPKIFKSLTKSDLNMLLKYRVPAHTVILYNCQICSPYEEIYCTFKNCKRFDIGVNDNTTYKSNKMNEFPCKGLINCCDIESLNLSNVHLFTINAKIGSFKNLLEINLSSNKITSIPKEFCMLNNLEICLLSYNNILYLPEDFINLKRLRILHLEGNVLCMLPEGLCALENLKCLDVYSNNLDSLPEDYSSIEEVDFAQNYCDEPDNTEYLKKKEKLRLRHDKRWDGRKPEIEHEYPHSDGHEEFDYSFHSDQEKAVENADQESEEDWDCDSDDYFDPTTYVPYKPFPIMSAWDRFVLQKIGEGNFCPFLSHVAPVKANYNKFNPETMVEGQFDDIEDEDDNN